MDFLSDCLQYCLCLPFRWLCSNPRVRHRGEITRRIRRPVYQPQAPHCRDPRAWWEKTVALWSTSDMLESLLQNYLFSDIYVLVWVTGQFSHFCGYSNLLLSVSSSQKSQPSKEFWNSRSKADWLERRRPFWGWPCVDIVLLPWCCAELTPGGDFVEIGSGLDCAWEGLEYHRRVIWKMKEESFLPRKTVAAFSHECL